MALKTRIVIAEDHQLFREGLKAILESSDTFEVVGEASDGLEAIRCVRKTQPDLMLLDLSMPRLGGISVVNEVRRLLPDLKILVLTMHESDQFVLDAFQAGANGFCLKTSSRNELMTAIDEVLTGNTYISPKVAGEVVKGYIVGKSSLKSKSNWETISQREREVLKLVAEGYTSKEIVSILNISIKTVEKHRANIKHKLKLNNSAAFTAYAIEKGLVDSNR